MLIGKLGRCRICCRKFLREDAQLISLAVSYLVCTFLPCGRRISIAPVLKTFDMPFFKIRQMGTLSNVPFHC